MIEKAYLYYVNVRRLVYIFYSVLKGISFHNMQDKGVNSVSTFQLPTHNYKANFLLNFFNSMIFKLPVLDHS